VRVVLFRAAPLPRDKLSGRLGRLEQITRDTTANMDARVSFAAESRCIGFDLLDKRRRRARRKKTACSITPGDHGFDCLNTLRATAGCGGLREKASAGPRADWSKREIPAVGDALKAGYRSSTQSQLWFVCTTHRPILIFVPACTGENLPSWMPAVTIIST